MSNKIKVWRHGPAELVDMFDLKKGDFFQLDRKQERSGIMPDELFLAGEDGVKLNPTDESGPTAEVIAYRMIFDPHWGSEQ